VDYHVIMTKTVGRKALIEVSPLAKSRQPVLSRRIKMVRYAAKQKKNGGPSNNKPGEI